MCRDNAKRIMAVSIRQDLGTCRSNVMLRGRVQAKARICSFMTLLPRRMRHEGTTMVQEEGGLIPALE